MAPKPPNVRSAPAKPWRSSVPPNVRSAPAEPWRSSITPSRRMRRGLAGLLAGALACSALSGGSTGAQPSLARVTIGHSNYRNDVASLWGPAETGIFRKHGLDVTVALVEGGRKMTQAILAGSVPMGMTGVPTVAAST